MPENFFKDKKTNPAKLIKYGFVKKSCYEMSFDMMDKTFLLTVKIDDKNKVETKLSDKTTNEIYTLHLVEGVKGAFVGQIKEEYNNILKDISEKCFEYDIFKEKVTLSVIKYAKDKYGDFPEYLWEKNPRNAVLRRKDTQKWYAAILTVKKCRLGLEGDDIIEILNIRAQKENVPNLLKLKNIYPAYHMNKKNWITVILDGSVPVESIVKMIDTSYKLALK